MGLLCGCAASTYNSPTPTVVSPSSAILSAGQSVQFAVTGSTLISLADPTWMVNGAAGGSATTGTITASGVYTAPASPSAPMVQVTEGNLQVGLVSTAVPVTLISAENIPPGTVTSTNNPQVAMYTFQSPQGASVQVQFGMSTNYGLMTGSQIAPPRGGAVSTLVAGMRANTTYHMQAIVQLPGGQTVFDTDHAYTTGDLPANLIPSITVTPAGPGVAPGIELLDLFQRPQNQLAALATDLSGNVIWYYALNPGEVPFPIKLLPNGHMLLVISGGFANAASVPNEVREIDLAGNIISRLFLTDIQTALVAKDASFQILGSLHHDILKLPNGHLICLVGYSPPLPGGEGFSPVVGDALVDWDPQQNTAVWTWSTFDHIPLTRTPVSAIDWTHSNAVIYSPDDGNLILSMRNQNWIVKINYQNGAGDGRILWHLGEGGDFTLTNGPVPIEWNYGQHYPTILSPNSSGIFQMMLFNNGNNRLVDISNDSCDGPAVAACYSSVPVYELNESANTAQVVSEDNLSPIYTTCCGNASPLSNGNLEYDIAADVNTPNISYIQEVTGGPSPQLVWQLNVANQLMYRGFRIPSLYPGVEWTQAAIGTANTSAVKKSKGPSVAGQR